VADYVNRIRALRADVPVATLIDSATPFDQFEKLLSAMEQAGADMVVLSRLPVTDDQHLKVIRNFAAQFLRT
jgi:hypothetical protein